MAKANETIADIIAAKRRLAAEMEKALGDQHTSVEMLKDDADRIEAAHKREMATAEKSSAVGNAAKLYEAVGYILKYADSAACRDHDEHTRHYIDQIRKWAQSALAAPPRNCENYATLDDAFRAWREEPPNGMSFDEWLFAYEEGGAK